MIFVHYMYTAMSPVTVVFEPSNNPPSAPSFRLLSPCSWDTQEASLRSTVRRCTPINCRAAWQAADDAPTRLVISSTRRSSSPPCMTRPVVCRASRVDCEPQIMFVLVLVYQFYGVRPFGRTRENKWFLSKLLMPEVLPRR